MAQETCSLHGRPQKNQVLLELSFSNRFTRILGVSTLSTPYVPVFLSRENQGWIPFSLDTRLDAHLGSEYI